MTEDIAQLDYESKSSDYFGNPRPEILPFVPIGSRRVLDVGCADGSFGAALKQARDVQVWGVEPTRSAAQKAAKRLDKVIEGVFGPEAGLPVQSFDCIFFNDVLEHMLVPEEELRYARSLLGPGGVVVASIPNLRSFPTIWQLIFRGRFEYADYGVLDRTHLRFFTKSSVVAMFEREGYGLQNVCGINAYCPPVGRRLWLPFRVANALLLNKLDDMKFQQFVVVAGLAT